jgi:hypothetical protein
VLTSPNMSLYCLDQESQCAIFVELPADVNLTTVPFVFQTQYEQAQRLTAVPYPTYLQLAHTLPAIRHLIVIYMLPRSGSTLVSQLLNAVDGVVSLSEPDAPMHLVDLRQAHSGGEASLRELLDATMRLLFKPGAWGVPATCAFKSRLEGLQLLDLVQANYPQAKNLYLYRDACSVVASFHRIFKRLQVPEYKPIEDYLNEARQQFHRDMTYQLAYLDPGAAGVSTIQQLTLGWLTLMEQYLAQHALGIPILAVRYDDLNTRREQVVTAILDYCGLRTAQMPGLLDVFAQDTQAGSPLARENPSVGNQLRLSDEEVAQLTQILERHPVIKTSDFVLPGTLQV